MIESNPAKLGVDDPVPPRMEQRPFESWPELEALAEAIGPRYGPMIIFAAATGLCPAEWIALEKRDIDRDGGVVYVAERSPGESSSGRRPTPARGRCRCRQ
jgi:integrase